MVITNADSDYNIFSLMHCNDYFPKGKMTYAPTHADQTLYLIIPDEVFMITIVVLWYIISSHCIFIYLFTSIFYLRLKRLQKIQLFALLFHTAYLVTKHSKF